MTESATKILQRMLDRLFAGLADGPALNCRPHSSRQRIDFGQLGKLRDAAPEDALRHLLGEKPLVKLSARVSVPPRTSKKDRVAGRDDDPREADASPEDLAARKAWDTQQGVLGKLRVLAEEARTYEQDTGAHALHIGFPLLSLPPGSGSGAGRTLSRRVLAPIAFIPVTLSVRVGASSSVEIAAKEEGVDRVMPNTALFAWLEQQTGMTFGEFDGDEKGEHPWREIAELVQHVAGALKLPVPAPFSGDPSVLDATAAMTPPNVDGEAWAFALDGAPRGGDDARPAILSAAVLGLFPTDNEGLLRDTRAMLAGEACIGPVQNFLEPTNVVDSLRESKADSRNESTTLDSASESKGDSRSESTPLGSPRKLAEPTRFFGEERLVAPSDPCQTRAVRLARHAAGLVVHGPPGTGKSQTITNIIGDHVARGERVLLVCDKRTALDVVADRLEHLGLGSLCALVHDPRRDQKDLYRSIRERLENLTEVHTDDRAERRLAKLDAELTRLHADLTAFVAPLAARDAGSGLSLHDLIGRWLVVPEDVEIDPELVAGATWAEFERCEAALDQVLSRAAGAGLATNPWAKAAGIPLDEFLARPLDYWRAALHGCVETAADADATIDERIVPFAARSAVAEQGGARADLAQRLRRILDRGDRAALARWAKQDVDAVRRARRRLADARTHRDRLEAGSLDAELALVVQSDMPALANLSRDIGVLEAYLAVAAQWYGFIFQQRRKNALEVLGRFGLSPGIASAQKLRDFLGGLRARAALQGLAREWLGQPAKTDTLMPDEELLAALATFDALFDILDRLELDPALAGLAAPVRAALADAASAPSFLGGLEAAAARAQALGKLRERLTSARLFEGTWIGERIQSGAAGQPACETLRELHQRFDTLESVLRVRKEQAALPDWLRKGVAAVAGKQGARATLEKAVLAAEITARIRATPALQDFDRLRLQTLFARHGKLEEERRAATRDLTLHRWAERQKSRLLVGTQSRLNSAGADLRRRLTLRGERALKLRQVIALGLDIEDGDPLFDLCPVWMASPPTVAQIFPRRGLFDVVIFDEASQCRLEEALPVLTRAKRVVIAGDPQQLPPTRFFESALAVSEEEEVETEAQLFEVHQTETEDLLNAALGIDIRQCYLDVHYRSRNADLIAFSNEQFYQSRLQPLPGHPARRARFAPLTLYRASGIYTERSNPIEAEQVCRIVRDLLKRAEPPSIGIACFNLTQRDVIVEKLDELAESDAEFATKLADARSRRGAGASEGLFVKNLENVQGDERDHMIISTTYGPDAQGRFYRRFGPLGRQGGGRRLNVLVTRARQEVHLVTSIPPEVYRDLPSVPTGQTPTGGWLLFAYLAFAERLAKEYDASRDEDAPGAKAPTPQVIVHASRSPSLFAEALARRVAAEEAATAEVHWGNDGFCIDVTIDGNNHGEAAPLGVLCDGARFPFADDAVEWDLFRTAVLEAMGWRLHRVWSPHFVRDPRGEYAQLVRAWRSEEKARVLEGR